jgi:O-antigen ligase
MLLQDTAIAIPHRSAVANRRTMRSPYTASGIALSTILVLTSFLDLFTRIKFGTISANGFLTVLYGAMAMLLLLLKRNVPGQVLSAARPGIALVIWAIASILWNVNRSVEAVQNTCVMVLFVASIILVASQAASSGKASPQILKQLPWVLYFSTALFVSTVLHLYSVQARLFALYASVGVMWFAAGWRFHEKRARTATIIMVFCIGWSLSRTALIGCILVLPWILSFRGKSLTGLLRPILTLSFLGVVTLGAIFSVPSLHQRFFEQGDQGVTVNGTTISTEGRAEIWAVVYADAMHSPIVGHGAGSATDLVTKVFGVEIAQPHNDYLRIFHDYGLIGLALWIAFITSLVTVLRRRYRLAKSLGNVRQQRNIIAALSGMLMILLSMTTDNIIIYPGPMFLEAVLLGNALGAVYGDKRPARSKFFGPSFVNVGIRSEAL